MFSNFSKAGVGIAIVSVLKVIFPWFGIEVPDESILQVVESVGVVIGFILMVYGQLDRKDLKMGLLRK